MKRCDPKQPPPRPVVIFAVQAFLLALLIGHLPSPKAHFPAFFHAQAGPLLSFLTGHPLRFEVPDAVTLEGVDTTLKGYAYGSVRPVWISQFSVVRIGYWPAAVLVAMILSTPLTPLRKWMALAVGLLCLDLFTLGRVGIEVMYAYYEVLHGLGQAVRGPLHLLLRVGSESLTASIPSVAAVLSIWVLVADPRHTLDVGSLRRRFSGRPAACRKPGDPMIR